MELTADQKGAIAESAIVHAAIKLGIGVFRPLTDGHRYDLVFEVDDRLLRIQCKWAVQLENVVMVRCYSARRTINGMLNRPYTADEVDLVAAYCASIDRCFVLPPELFGGRRHVHLRLRSARNNQSQGINWADDYSFDRLASTSTNGAVAQLGERRAGSAKARGSSPLGSTQVQAR